MLLDARETTKKTAGSFDRTVPVEETLRFEAPLRAFAGVTRIAELTYLDRIGIPVFAAMVPDSRDVISVYLGKGLSREAARAGAIMEAAERRAGSAAHGEVRQARELFSGADITMPAQSGYSSNGLASGNTATEAVYHALCEVIERHVLAVAHAFAHERPREALAAILGRRIEITGFLDTAIATAYAMPTGSAIVDRLITQIEAAGVPVRLRAVQMPPFPPLFVATIGGAPSTETRIFRGYGMSLCPEHAAIRALTEAAQVRLVDINTARDDLFPDTIVDGVARRAPVAPTDGEWSYGAPARPASLTGMADRSSDDVATDVSTLLEVIRAAGFHRVALTDLTPPGLPAAIVRIVVPGMEDPCVPGTTGSTLAALLDPSQPVPDPLFIT